MDSSLKNQVFKGVGWNTIERFSVQGTQFLLQIILARLLLPSDYGIIAMLAIFLGIAQVFVDSGFGNALIQKRVCTNIDYSTVFYYNLVVSIGIYFLFYIISPFVADFYNIPDLKIVMRVISLTIIINALTLVQRTILIKKVDFKSQSKVVFVSVLISGICSVLMAYEGFGVWSLCFQSILNGALQVVFFYFYVKWLPSLTFSIESFKEFFGYGSKILIASIISVIYNNLYTIVIGKKFSARELGYFSRADHFSAFPSSNIGGIISRVSLPVLSKIQDDDVRLRKAYCKLIRYSSFIIFPLMTGLAALSEPLIRVVLGQKWMGIVALLQIMCLGAMWDHLSSLNLNLLYVKGKTSLVLRLEIIKKTIAIIILIISLPFGLYLMCWGRVLYSLIAFYINTYYTNQIIGLPFRHQFLDVIPIALVSIFNGLLILLIVKLLYNTVLSLLIGFLFGVSFYMLVTIIFSKDIKYEILKFLQNTK